MSKLSNYFLESARELQEMVDEMDHADDLLADLTNEHYGRRLIERSHICPKCQKQRVARENGRYYLCYTCREVQGHEGLTIPFNEF